MFKKYQTIVIAPMIASDFPYSSCLSDLSGPFLIIIASSDFTNRLPTSCEGAKGIQRAPYSWASHPQYCQWPGLTLVKLMVLHAPSMFPQAFSRWTYLYTSWSLETNFFFIYAHLYEHNIYNICICSCVAVWIYEYIIYAYEQTCRQQTCQGAMGSQIIPCTHKNQLIHHQWQKSWLMASGYGKQLGRWRDLWDDWCSCSGPSSLWI